jgi:catechol 2,3-dioxygenase-like lactoylglutathione lyase family enzyme
MNLLHFGFKVKDISRSTALYAELFGIVWDPIREYDVPVTVDGEARRNRSYVTHGKTGDGTEIEMIQPLDGEVTDDIALGGREGISHVAFAVKDLALEKARLRARGISIVGEGTAPRADWLFVADPWLGGALVQLVQLHEEKQS